MCQLRMHCNSRPPDAEPVILRDAHAVCSRLCYSFLTFSVFTDDADDVRIRGGIRSAAFIKAFRHTMSGGLIILRPPD